MKKSTLNLIAVAVIGGSSTYAASQWDNGFPVSPPLGSSERISAICYLRKLYVAVNNPSVPSAHLLRLDGSTWNAVPNGTVNGLIYALSGASASAGDRLFVGGSFTLVGDPPSSLEATNIAMLNP